MEQISQSYASTYQSTADNIAIEATKRVEGGRTTVAGHIKNGNNLVASLYIDDQQGVSTIVIYNKSAFAESAVMSSLEANLVSWIKQLIDI